MRGRKLIPLAALLLVGLAGCKDTELRAELRDWFDRPDGLHDWQTRVQNSLCHLEAQVGIPVAERSCPGGIPDPTVPPDPPDWD